MAEEYMKVRMRLGLGVKSPPFIAKIPFILLFTWLKSCCGVAFSEVCRPYLSA
jgi:hypothetical protein